MLIASRRKFLEHLKHISLSKDISNRVLGPEFFQHSECVQNILASQNKHKVHTSCDVIVRHIRTMHVAQDPDLLIKGLFLSLIF